jgi:hypothetical protein
MWRILCWKRFTSRWKLPLCRWELHSWRKEHERVHPPLQWTDIFTEVQELLHCAESYTNITSHSFSSFPTSADVHEASIECVAACQRSDICNYWTLDVERHVCELKRENTGKVESKSAISGERKCNSFEVQEDMWCSINGCDPKLTITSYCGNDFTVQILAGNYKAA